MRFAYHESFRSRLQIVATLLTSPVALPLLVVRGFKGVEWWLDACINLPCRWFGHGREADGYDYTDRAVCSDCIECVDRPTASGPLPPAPREPLHTEGEYR